MAKAIVVDETAWGCRTAEVDFNYQLIWIRAIDNQVQVAENTDTVAIRPVSA